MTLLATQEVPVLDRIERSGGWRLVMQGQLDGFDAASGQLTSQHVASHPVTCLGIAFYLAKRGNTHASRTLIDEVRKRKRAGIAGISDTTDADMDLVDLHISIYEDRELGESEAQRLDRVLNRLAPDDHLGRALAMNHLCTVYLHLGEFNRSQGYAEGAMRAYRVGAAHYGALHLHTHLGQIRLARGELSGAAREYQAMEEGLLSLDQERPEMMSICQALSSEVAYEMNDLSLARSLLDTALFSFEDQDAWLDVLAAAYRVSTRLALLESGLPGALSALAHAENIASERGMPRLRRLMRIEKIRALTLCDEIVLARQEIKHAKLDRFIAGTHWDDEADWAMRQGSTAVALARYLVRAGHTRQALSVINTAEDRAIRYGQLLSVAKLRVIRASALWRTHKRQPAVTALIDAVRLLGKQPFRRFILDEGAEMQQLIQRALDDDQADARSNPQLHKRLAELSHHWAVREHQPGPLHRETPCAFDDGTPQDCAQRYLQLLAVGLSNKEISRTMGVSENTVKYHLKSIFKRLRVHNRTRAVNRARELGVI